jgi:dCTP deaminase
LPRPTEPVELRRFCRVISKQIIKLEGNENDNISIYVNENTEDNTYALDPLNRFKLESINPLLESINGFFQLQFKNNQLDIPLFDEREANLKNTTIHISIPRIEAGNPCHWPTLIHEVAHNLMKAKWFNNQGLFKDFNAFLKRNVVTYGIGEIVKVINLESWLLECWCDLFACALIGPSFYFSQYSVFIHSLRINDNRKYPSNLFRLKIIQKFIAHRFSNLIEDVSFLRYMDECESLLSIIDEKNNAITFENNDELSNIFILFNQYFINEFFILEGGVLNFKDEDLNTLFNNISSFVNKFELDKLKQLTSQLNKGYPIPSSRIPVENNPLFEKPNFVQEILLAGWVYRNDKFKNKIIGILQDITVNASTIDLGKDFKTKIVNEFYRFDQAILKSIQVSEWVDLLIDENEASNKIEEKYKQEKATVSDNILVDRDIYEEIKNDNIYIIPLINVESQLGSTSLDIRLGTSFEIFYPNQFGIVDFTNKESLHNFKYNSKKINLDFMDSIPINPGQFMLGHSMEYIKLPDYLSADLEGRSSFARLGIEIHMTAGFVDPGFDGVLTFEIFNAGTNPVMLYPGYRIGQLRFMKISEPSVTYANRNPKYKGLLEHRFSLQSKDYEIKKIKDEKTKRKI